MSETKVDLEDGWTTDADYKKLYQTDQDIVEILELLDLETAEALLDNGCGNGELSIQAVRAHPKLTVYGFDGLESAIEEARSRSSTLDGEQLSFEVAWADNLPLADSSVDRALFRNVLHHVSKPGLVFDEFARCLRPGGKLVMQTPWCDREDSFSEFLTEFHLLMDDSHRRFYHHPKRICEDLANRGFSATLESAGTYPFPFVTEPMKNFLLENRFEHQLELKQVSEDNWSVALQWGRITAVKSG